MTPEQIETVQSTWRAVVPIADQAADLFYDRLFVLDERLRSLFPDDLTDQKKKLMSMIGRVVTALRDVNSIVPAVQDLGRRHVGYGVRDEDYATVAQALLWTLEKGLGEGWTPPVKESWVAAYTLLSGVMVDAAHQQAGGTRPTAP
jgi:hemoglobin-like flavoprotein